MTPPESFVSDAPNCVTIITNEMMRLRLRLKLRLRLRLRLRLT
jgi:hypothetical protein